MPRCPASPSSSSLRRLDLPAKPIAHTWRANQSTVDMVDTGGPGYSFHMSDHTEQFDEDNLGLDPLEEGMDPPEHWAQADRFGNTEREMREGQDLDHRLAEEQSDTASDPPQDRPVGATPDTDLDERIDDETDDVEPVA